MASSPRDALREQVAEFLWDHDSEDASWESVADECRENADELLTLVLGVITAEIEALPSTEVHPAFVGFAGPRQPRSATDFKRDVQDVLARHRGNG